jgi:Ca-activated chloride channel family protein
VESATKVLQENILPKINVQDEPVSEALAAQYAVNKVPDSLPKLEDFPLAAAQPSTDANILYLEIFGSSEKSNADKQDERWLVDVAEAFNARQQTLGGKTIQVGIRFMPSVIGQRLIAAQRAKPAGYSPSTDLSLAFLESEGIKPTVIAPSLVPNYAGFVVREDLYRSLSQKGPASFDDLLGAILAGKVVLGYPNPYTSSISLNLLHTLLWQAAGHNQDGKPLTVKDLQSPAVTSVFDAFQKQVLVTTRTSRDLRDIFIRDPDKLQAFPLEYQNYVNLKSLPGFENTAFIPFGLPHRNPLVALPWTTAEQQQALQKFAVFAQGPDMQQKAQAVGWMVTDYLKQGKFPPLPQGEVIKTAQSFWKARKDSGKTVYMNLVIDTSGSMRGQRIQAVKAALKQAIQEINAGNYVGLVTFGDRPRRLVKLAPFDTRQQQRLLAALEEMNPDGSTAMYDGTLVALADLLAYKQKDPNGRFYLLLLSDGENNRGFSLSTVKDVLRYSDVRIYPIAYGEVNQAELQSVAALRESTVEAGDPQQVATILKELFQTNL